MADQADTFAATNRPVFRPLTTRIKAAGGGRVTYLARYNMLISGPEIDWISRILDRFDGNEPAG